jgi:hypothetical protein
VTVGVGDEPVEGVEEENVALEEGDIGTGSYDDRGW